MLIEQIWTGNSMRNFNYLIACPERAEALAVDPLDYRRCLEVAGQRGWTITQIVNTHEHGDHTGGNKGMVAATGAIVIGHRDASGRIPHMSRGVGGGDTITVGTTVGLACLDTPGHTMTHICLLSQTDPPCLFSGDTLFNAGAGNCHNGGHPDELYETFARQLERLPGDTRIYPGHDYLHNNLRFTLDREPDNVAASRLLAATENQDPHTPYVTTLGEEREINTFFRLQSATVIARLRERFPDLAPEPTPRDVFLKLRELRNSW